MRGRRKTKTAISRSRTDWNHRDPTVDPGVELEAVETADFSATLMAIHALPEADRADIDPTGLGELIARMRPGVAAHGLQLRTLTFGEAEQVFPGFGRRREVPVTPRIASLLERQIRAGRTEIWLRPDDDRKAAP